MEHMLTPVERLSRDMRVAAQIMSLDQVRFLVDAYYTMQRNRIRSENQVRNMVDGEEPEPHQVIEWLAKQNRTLEEQVKGALDRYSMASDVGRWSRAQKGIGPVLAAGLIAHIDAASRETVGHIWSFAGLLDPRDQTWEKGQKRPWNARLKTLCWKIGQSFVKVSGYEDAHYGHLYQGRKRYEWEGNVAGRYGDQAEAKLRANRFGAETDALVWYSGRLSADAAVKYLAAPAEARQGLLKKLAGDPGSGVPMLPPARIELRSQRVAVKMFLSHWHHVAYVAAHGREPPKPYVITQLGHADYVPPPLWTPPTQPMGETAP
jgi:hypothetical protein